MNDKAMKEKVCREEDCQEQWNAISPDLRQQCDNFVYCPFCSGEMVTRCSVCGETISDSDYRFCPWCGADFQG